MRSIAELDMFLRIRAELPAGLKLVTEEFREGWNSVRRVSAERLEKKIHTRGWSFIKIADGLLRSGVGETWQQATASALKLALRQMSEHFNAVEVKHIELTQYPWFFLARVTIHPYRIQQSAVLSGPDDAEPLPIAPQSGRLPRDSAALYPHFASAMPHLKQMLVLPGGLQARPQ